MSKVWLKVRLGDVLSLDLDRVPVDAATSYPMVGVLSFGRGLFEREPIENGKTTYRVFYRLKADHVVMSQLFGWEGALALSSEKFAGKFLSPQFPTFLCEKTKLDRSYLGWLMRRPTFWEDLGTRASGMGDRRRTLNPDALFASEIPLPPLAEQRRIVARIEGLGSQIHEARALRAQAFQDTEAVIAKISGSIFDSIKSATMPLGKVAEKKTGTAYKADDFVESGGAPVVRLREIGTKSPTVYLKNPDAYDNVWLETGDIVLAKTSFSTGAMCQWSGPRAVLNQNAVMLRAREPVEQRFLYAWLGQQVSRYLNDHLADPKFYPYIRESDLVRWLVPVPSISEQRRIVAELDALQAEVNALKRLQTETAAELDALLPAILDRAFKGEL